MKFRMSSNNSVGQWPIANANTPGPFAVVFDGQEVVIEREPIHGLEEQLELGVRVLHSNCPTLKDAWDAAGRPARIQVGRNWLAVD